jgi:hypothetical protein
MSQGDGDVSFEIDNGDASPESTRTLMPDVVPIASMAFAKTIVGCWRYGQCYLESGCHTSDFAAI